MTVHEVLNQAAGRLNHAEAKHEAQYLMQAALKVDHAWLITHANDALSVDSKTAFLTLIDRRSKGEPIAYILGEREFYGLPFKVSEDTLIPRADTETLVEVALDKLDAHVHDGLEVLDLGTGAGVIALVIAHYRPDLGIIGVDASDKALAVAQKNADQLNVENVSFVQSDWYAALSAQRFDFIVSNPPYIEENDQHLNQGDLRFEPKAALASGADGLDDIRHILNDCLVYLKPQGWIMLEHGYNQAEPVQQLMAEVGLVEVQTVKDLGGNDRVTLGKNPLVISQHWSE